MTKEEKQLLLADLCGRLPYGVKVAIEYTKGKYTRTYDLKEIDNDVTYELKQRVTVWNYGFYSSVVSYPLIECRPYLRPLLSMTEEERHIFDKMTRGYTVHQQASLFDWLNAHHFDYRGLIEKGLAIEAPEGMYGKGEKQ